MASVFGGGGRIALIERLNDGLQTAPNVGAASNRGWSSTPILQTGVPADSSGAFNRSTDDAGTGSAAFSIDAFFSAFVCGYPTSHSTAARQTRWTGSSTSRSCANPN